MCEVEKPKDFGYIIRRDSTSKEYWDFFTIVFTVTSLFMIPINIAFGMNSRNKNIQTLDIVIDSVFLVDIMLNFITDNFSEPGQDITNRQIAWRYVRGSFIWDLAESLPGLIVQEQYTENTRWIYLSKISRYIHIGSA